LILFKINPIKSKVLLQFPAKLWKLNALRMPFHIDMTCPESSSTLNKNVL